MVHVICTSHRLHRTAEQIRIQFLEVDKLVANVNRVFKKTPYRVQKFHTDAPYIPLPPNIGVRGFVPQYIIVKTSKL